MKKISALLFSLITGALFFAAPVQAAVENYKLDPNHSYVLWHISHFDFSNPSGKWMANGTLNLDEANPQNSKVNAVIQINTLQTGVKELDEHLNGDLFFDSKKYPTATFSSDKIVMKGKDQAQVYGKLTVHGVTKPVMLDVKLNKIAVSPITDKKTAGFSATTKINRSDFGINTLLPGLGDEVTIEIQAEAIKND